MNDDVSEIRTNLVALSDDELLRIVTIERDQFRQEAVDLAIEELNRRHVPIRPPEKDGESENFAAHLPPIRNLTYRVPPMWPGFAIAFAFLLAETVEAVKNPEASERITLVPVLIAVGGWLYWIWCMRAVRMVIAESSGDPNQSKPRGIRSLFWLHGLSWLIKWPADVATFVNSRLGPSTISSRWSTTGLLAGILLSRFDAGLGLIVVFSVGTHLRRRMLVGLGLAEDTLAGLTRP